MTRAKNKRKGDPGYHDRHTKRTIRRAACIAKHIRVPSTFLDVGCNRGLTTSFLLRNGKAVSATGIELARETVGSSLLLNDRFSFIEGDICETALPDMFDAVFYGAVHHHIVRERGLDAAIQTLQKLTSHCRSQLFFETGHLTEGSRWKWQRSLRQYFRTDEEHLFYLLRHIEPRVEAFDIIGKFRIHGARRWLLRIQMKPMPSSSKRPEAPAVDLQDRELESFTRTFGSIDQRLHALPETGNSSVIYSRTADGNDPKFFLKERPLAPHVTEDEYRIGADLDLDWAVRPIGFASERRLVFPLIEGTSIQDWIRSNPSFADKRNVAAYIIRMFRDLRTTTTAPFHGLLLPLPKGGTLAQVVDFNINNILVITRDKRTVVLAVDFERQSNSYLWRNRLHVSSILLKLGQNRLYSVYLKVLGLLGGCGILIVNQFRPVQRRIASRQPSAASVLSTEMRSHAERILVRLFPKLSEN